MDRSLRIEEGLPDDSLVGGLTRQYDLRAVHWETSAHLMSIANDATATNAGWAIEAVDFVRPSSNSHYIQARIRVGARDIDGWIVKVGYRLAVTGTITYHDLPPIN